MPPKLSDAKKTRRKVGLLGQPAYNSDEDDDWVPSGGKPKASDSPAQKTAIVTLTALARTRSSGDSDDEPSLAKRSRRGRGQLSGDGGGTTLTQEHPMKRPRGKTQKQHLNQEQAQPSETQPSPTTITRSGSASRTRRSTASAPLAGSSCGWSTLTTPLLLDVLRRACQSSALPVAGSAPCVCRHWRGACQELEAQAVAEAASAASHTIQEAVASALAAAGAAPRPETRAGLRPGPVVEVGLWACLDVRCRPSVRFTDAVVRRGMPSRRWKQVHTLRLSTPGPSAAAASGGGGASGGPQELTPGALVTLAECCPRLTCLDLSQCDSLIRPDTLRSVLLSLSRLRALHLNNLTLSSGGALDAVIRAALAPRGPITEGQEQGASGSVDAGDGGSMGVAAGAGQQHQQRVVAAGTGRAGNGGSGGGDAGGWAQHSWALPCPLQVLCVRGCPYLGPGAFKALAPDNPYVTLPPPSPPSSPNPTTGDTDAAPPPPSGRAVPLFVHLTQLDLTGSGTLTKIPFLALEKLQAAAPNLQELRLDATGSAIYAHGLELGPERDPPGPGFPELRVCQLGLSRSTDMMNNIGLKRRGSTLQLLRRVVGAARHLHTLDVSGAMSTVDQNLLTELFQRLKTAAAIAVTVTCVRMDGPNPINLAPFVPHPDDDEEEEAHGGDADVSGIETAAAVGATAVAAETAAVAAVGPCPDPSELRRRLHLSLGRELARAVVGPLRELRASRSLLASDAGLQALAARFGATLQVIDVSESSHVTDAGLLHVAYKCTALTWLDVSGTAITDWGIKCLVALRCSSSLPAAGGSKDAGAGSSDTGGMARGSGRGSSALDWPHEGLAGKGASRKRSVGRSAHVPKAGVKSGSDEGRGTQGRGRVVYVAGGGDGVELRHLDINSCRGVERELRHAAALGLVELRRLLRL